MDGLEQTGLAGNGDTLMTAADSEITTVFEGTRPKAAGDLRDLESWGIAPIGESGRYGGAARVFWPWYSGNMELSAVFLGTIAVSLGLGVGLGAAATIIGIVLGAVAVAYLGTWGPQTGTGQVPLARVPFGKTILVPGVIQWLSAVAWVAIGCYFGAGAAQLFFHVPFLLGAAIVLAVIGFISARGYEWVMQAEKWGAVLMTVMFAVLTVRIFAGHHVTLPHDTVHGGALAGAFVLMVAIALSGSFSWASYGSDYSRYLEPRSSKPGIFWWTMAGMTVSYGWLAVVGLAGASVLGDQTVAGVKNVIGGGAAVGYVTLALIMLAEVTASSMNAYSGSLAAQSLNIRLRRPMVAIAGVVLAFLLIWWMYSGDLIARFTNLLLFTGYWLSPFVAIVLIDWYYNKRRYTPGFLETAMAWRNMRPRWGALIAFTAGFGAMVPFMNTSLWTGPAATALDGADLAYYVGFIVTAVLYYLLRRYGEPAAAAAPVLAKATEA